MPPELIIFDFDGVIVDSVRIKRDAFAHVFRKETPETIAWVQELDDRFPEKSRYEKFDITYAEYFKRVLTPEKKALHGGEFSDYCYQKIVTCPYIPGALEFLKNPFPEGLAMTVASATPEPELLRILEARGIDRFFRQVMGSPRKKPEMIREIMTLEAIASTATLFIGDAMSDYRAARETGIPFVARAAGNDVIKFSNLPGCVGIIPDIAALPEFLNSI